MYHTSLHVPSETLSKSLKQLCCLDMWDLRGLRQHVLIPAGVPKLGFHFRGILTEAAEFPSSPSQSPYTSLVLQGFRLDGRWFFSITGDSWHADTAEKHVQCVLLNMPHRFAAVGCALRQALEAEIGKQLISILFAKTLSLKCTSQLHFLYE